MNTDKPMKEPDLKILLNRLKDEVYDLKRKSESVNNKLGFIDKNNKPQDKVKEDKDPISCFVDEVNSIIFVLKDINVEMDDTELRMINLVG